MNGFLAVKDSPLDGTFAYDDVDNNDRFLHDGGPPWDVIIRAYTDFHVKRKLWPKPRIENTRWKVESMQGKDVVCDGERDSTDYLITVIELRDFNNEILAVYRNDGRNDRLNLDKLNEDNNNLRVTMPGQHRPGEHYRAARTKDRLQRKRGLRPSPR